MRVGFDVAPLVLDNAGTARYVRGIRDELRTRVELDELQWGGDGRATAAVRDVAWYPLLLPLAARKLDVLHCTTFRAPLRASVPVIVEFCPEARRATANIVLAPATPSIGVSSL